jgi:hypothetical protein
MDSRTLANLRRKRIYIHKQLDRLEPAVARLRAFLDETNARIQAEVPELPLPPRRHKPNPIFGIGELPRLVREIMREAGGPISTRDIAAKALARKGVTLPGPGTMKRTRTRIGQLFIAWGPEKVRTVGRKQDRRRMLVDQCLDSGLSDVHSASLRIGHPIASPNIGTSRYADGKANE